MSEIFLDTETTGLSFQDGHKIVEIACIETKDLIPTNKIFHKHPDSSIALFGASVLATSIITYLESEKISKIKYIFDNDSQKHGKWLVGCDAVIQSPEQLIYAKFDVILITAYIFHEEIKEQLIKMGVGKKRIRI